MKKYNFNAGPSVLPDAALENAAKAIIDFNGTGLSILSISHRTKEFEEVLASAQSLFRELLHIPDNYKIFFVGGGASTQFFHIPANFLKTKAGYVHTGVRTHVGDKRYRRIDVGLVLRAVNRVVGADIEVVQIRRNLESFRNVREVLVLR